MCIVRQHVQDPRINSCTQYLYGFVRLDSRYGRSKADFDCFILGSSNVLLAEFRRYWIFLPDSGCRYLFARVLLRDCPRSEYQLRV